jgi:hypothetical protein
MSAQETPDPANPGKGDSKASSKSQETPEGAKKVDAITLLKNDHRKVEQLFQQYEQSDRRAEKQKLARQVCQELIIHTKLEEEIFYPACREHVDDKMLDEAQVEHDGAKVLINELLSSSPDQPFYDAKVKVLSEEIKHHVNEEEKRDGIFVKAKASGLDVDALGQELAERKAELTQTIEEYGLERPRPRSFVMRKMEDQMPQGQYRERDERGRFTSDDDDDRRSYSSRGRSRYEDEDDDRGGRGRGRGGWFGDSEGHSQAARQRGGGGRSMRDDDDGRGRGRGGWFGDSEGHSEASRRGWEHSDHEGSGWYGDPQGHSQASRRGWEHSDHEGSGWYGDPEGHSEAARRGWGESSGSRGRSRYEDDGGRSSRSMSSRGGGRSRSEDDDDDRRSSRGGRGHGGWFGDSEGHSQAARRGWGER